jgi:hypothetical protein
MSSVKVTGTPMSEEQVAEIEKKDFADVAFEYARGCLVQATSETKVKMTWINGNAYSATRGATIDYIEKHKYLHLSEKTKAYDFAADYNAMRVGGMNVKLAWIICMIRKVVLSYHEPQVLAAECVFGAEPADEFDVDASVVNMMKTQGPAINAIIQQTFTIMALNGQSLLQKGHHYSADDEVWNKLVNATGMDLKFQALGTGAWQGVLFHDALHPLDYDWVSSQVADSTTGLHQKVHGIAGTRMGQLPAGSTVLGLVKPLHAEVKIRNPTFAKLLDTTVDLVEPYLVRVRNTPLNYCVHMARDGTHARIVDIQKFEPVVAVMAGYLKKLGVKKATVVMAKSLNSIITRQSAAYSLGERAAEAFPLAEIDATTLAESIKMVIDVKSTVNV